ncbi:hypothetical protein BKA62DRAFT_761364 [Auriculariales sp. MPI-PUGE-AT-0066]|nr:hypothetical protein BKA62DRAFT_761364 [Auriculariales sp. MPI-PUGE-AT-0066]
MYNVSQPLLQMICPLWWKSTKVIESHDMLQENSAWLLKFHSTSAEPVPPLDRLNIRAAAFSLFAVNGRFERTLEMLNLIGPKLQRLSLFSDQRLQPSLLPVRYFLLDATVFVGAASQLLGVLSSPLHTLSIMVQAHQVAGFARASAVMWNGNDARYECLRSLRMLRVFITACGDALECERIKQELSNALCERCRHSRIALALSCRTTDQDRIRVLISYVNLRYRLRGAILPSCERFKAARIATWMPVALKMALCVRRWWRSARARDIRCGDGPSESKGWSQRFPIWHNYGPCDTSVLARQHFPSVDQLPKVFKGSFTGNFRLVCFRKSSKLISRAALIVNLPGWNAQLHPINDDSQGPACMRVAALLVLGSTAFVATEDSKGDWAFPELPSCCYLQYSQSTMPRLLEYLKCTASDMRQYIHLREVHALIAITAPTDEDGLESGDLGRREVGGIQTDDADTVVWDRSESN